MPRELTSRAGRLRRARHSRAGRTPAGRDIGTRWWAALLVEPVELVSFLMSQKMLRGIRARAESRHV